MEVITAESKWVLEDFLVILEELRNCQKRLYKYLNNFPIISKKMWKSEKFQNIFYNNLSTLFGNNEVISEEH